MLNKPNLELLFDDTGAFCGVKDQDGAVAKAPLVIGDPSYFVDKTRAIGKVVRAVCIMNHPIPNTGDSHSVQIIVPYSQVGRNNDIYVFCSSYWCDSMYPDMIASPSSSSLTQLLPLPNIHLHQTTFLARGCIMHLVGVSDIAWCSALVVFGMYDLHFNRH
jgi:hypothetical protein